MTARLKILRPEELNPTVCVVVGTRPGIIKQSPIIRALAEARIPHFVLHTGQHHSYEMDRKFFEDLELDPPTFRVEGVSECTLHGEQTARMLEGIERFLIQERPRIVLVVGDANTNLAAALASRKLQIRVAHIEAGLRSRDWKMPEEHNRVIVDHISEYLFPPTEVARRNLIAESVCGRIIVAGNPIVDAVQQNLDIARAKSVVLGRLDLSPGGYALLTSHREGNVDVRENLEAILDGVERAARASHLPVILPVHPRTKRRLWEFGLTNRTQEGLIRLVNPVGYLDFLVLLANARVVLTDSGGIQEEACILRIPCVTLRESTEWLETVEVGANVVTGVRPSAVLEGTLRMLEAARDWDSPYGDARASGRIAAEIGRALHEPSPVTS